MSIRGIPTDTCCCHGVPSFAPLDQNVPHALPPSLCIALNGCCGAGVGPVVGHARRGGRLGAQPRVWRRRRRRPACTKVLGRVRTGNGRRGGRRHARRRHGPTARDAAPCGARAVWKTKQWDRSPSSVPFSPPPSSHAPAAFAAAAPPKRPRVAAARCWWTGCLLTPRPRALGAAPHALAASSALSASRSTASGRSLLHATVRGGRRATRLALGGSDARQTRIRQIGSARSSAPSTATTPAGARRLRTRERAPRPSLLSRLVQGGAQGAARRVARGAVFRRPASARVQARHRARRAVGQHAAEAHRVLAELTKGGSGLLVVGVAHGLHAAFLSS